MLYTTDYLIAQYQVYQYMEDNQYSHATMGVDATEVFTE